MGIVIDVTRVEHRSPQTRSMGMPDDAPRSTYGRANRPRMGRLGFRHAGVRAPVTVPMPWGCRRSYARIGATQLCRTSAVGHLVGARRPRPREAVLVPAAQRVEVGVIDATNGLAAFGVEAGAYYDAGAADNSGIGHTTVFGRQTREAIDAFFGTRYQARSRYSVRVALMPGADAVSFAGLVHETSPTSGVYGGMSLIWFPIEATDAFGQLLDIFAQYAPDDALVLVPGHAYFLADSDEELIRRLRFELVPLLIEYLQEGRLGSCERELRAYLNYSKERWPGMARARKARRRQPVFVSAWKPRGSGLCSRSLIRAGP